MSIGACRMQTWRVAAGMGSAGAIVLALTFMAAAPCRASGPLDGILACRRIADGRLALACFERESAMLADPARQSAATKSQPCAKPPRAMVERARLRVSAVPARNASLDPQQTFGLPPMKILAREEAAQRLPPQLEHISARIEAISKAADGRDIFVLDNRETWAQLVPDEDLYAKPGDTVKISRAMLGSYWLALPSRRGGCKVTRVR